MQLYVQNDYAGMCKLAAKEIAQLVKNKPNAVIGLATGGTQLGLYKELIRMHKEEGLDFSKCTFFNLDEYVGLTADHPQSYHYYMHENFFKHVNVRPSQIHIPNGRAGDLIKECRDYEDTIKHAGGLDIQVLGIGGNGHIAFNEPGTSLLSRTHPVRLTKKTIQDNARFFSTPKLVPRQAITMGIASILSAKRVLLLASGKKKAAIMHKALEEPPTLSVPASLLQLHSNTSVVLDQEAAALISPNHQNKQAIALPKNQGHIMVAPKFKTLANALAHTTHMAVGAHPDDVEILGFHGIETAYSTPNKSFVAVVSTSGGGSVRSGKFAHFTNAQMAKARQEEQCKAAKLGKYGAAVLMGFESNHLKGAHKDMATQSFYQLFKQAKPEILYLHTPTDSHDTHVATFMRCLEALRMLKPEERPKHVYGCEVWKNLDWLPDKHKHFLPVKQPELARSLLSFYESQIIGQQKPYHEHTIARWQSNATYGSDSHEVGNLGPCILALDLMPLVKNPHLSVTEFVSRLLKEAKQEMLDKITRHDQTPQLDVSHSIHIEQVNAVGAHKRVAYHTA